MRQAIVILGTAVCLDERPSPALQRRINKAADLWHKGGFEVIVPAGGLGVNPPTEPEVIKRALIAAGVPPEAIIKEPFSTSTLTKAIFSAALLDKYAIRRVTVVTDGYHALRSFLTFRRQGLTPTVVPSDDAEPHPRKAPAIKGKIRELFALPVYIFRLYFQPMPALPSELNHRK